MKQGAYCKPTIAGCSPFFFRVLIVPVKTKYFSVPGLALYDRDWYIRIWPHPDSFWAEGSSVHDVGDRSA